MIDIKKFEADVNTWLKSDRYNDLVVRFAESISSNGITVRVQLDSRFGKPVVKVNWPSLGAVETNEFQLFLEQMTLAGQFAQAAQTLVDDFLTENPTIPFVERVEGNK